ncbi:MAG: aspartate--tRNA ligase [Kiritimatiellae bacterium]|nr:aspartate--tRNA ligase [Kiritimatiellia bacterium]
MTHPYRTHACGDLRAEHAGQEARLSGWVSRKRDHGSLLFIDLRDHYGVTQVVIQPDCDIFDLCQNLKLETVITVTGRVDPRSEETVNASIPTGAIELVAETVVEEGPIEGQLPLYLAGEEDGPEEQRLRYRFLDLRRPRMQRNIRLRSDVIASIRRRMVEQNFREYQTPILTSSSPEGARDYLVPSRVHPGKFYALPQAPQIFKQLLMIAGFDRYFQIAPCFRDEDARADRSPGEFYQLDIEMSFATQDEVFEVVENVLHGVFSEFSDREMDSAPFVRIPYAEAMLKYGTDKPDLRIPLEIQDVSDLFVESKFNVFRTVVTKGGVVRALRVPGISDKPRSFFDKMVEYAQSIGAKGLAYIVWDNGGVKGPVAKVLGEDEVARIAERCEVSDGDVVFFVSDKPKSANAIAGDIRAKLGADLDMIEKDVYRFCWIVDFPMFELDEDTQRVIFSHNPFSMPQGGLEALEGKDPLDVLAYQYDIVCNGFELSSGAIRNHRVDVMLKAFEIAGYDRETVETEFPSLFNAFKMGAPPHGGIAPGIDRIVMLLANESNIREVIAFPMNQRAQDLMMGAPCEVSLQQLRELHINLKLPNPPKGEHHEVIDVKDHS